MTSDTPLDVMCCPVCLFLMCEEAYELIRIDPACPRCGASLVSEFEPQRIGVI